ncbi:MAG: hypothetical protein SV062_05760, partial [Thermodesulfobacteriota bacterium]|nr:hypothetical protein [Thermodesulfobacteriota bacterium]
MTKFYYKLFSIIFSLLLISCAELATYRENDSGGSYSQQQISDFENKLDKMEKNYNDSILSIRKKQVDLEAILDKSHIEIQKLKGRMEENTYYTRQILKDQQGFQN